MDRTQHIVILGAAESGVGAAILAKIKGFSVFVSDAGVIKASSKEELQHYDIPFEEEGHTLMELLKADKVVKSPGIPSKAPIVLTLVEHQIPVVSEIEFARPFSKGKTVCITGSNGKTTTKNIECRIYYRSFSKCRIGK